MWRPPSSSCAALMKPRACSSSETSTSWTSVRPSRLPAIDSSRSVRRAPRATLAPAADNARTVASPIPEDAPVTAATRPSSGPAIAGSLPGDSACPQRQLQLEAPVGIVEPGAEQLAQACEPVAHGLRMHMERLRYRLGPAAVSQPRVERGAEPLARELGLPRQRRERRLGHVAG